jgi:ABC-type bacteriocin/lantibiotic exporter with double-glycine peptidase domain
MATSKKVITGLFFSFGITVMLWVTAAMMSALHTTGWSLGELVYQYMQATGMIKPMHTLVDFYTHIKGIEYLICVAFFVAFPVFVKYINSEKQPVTVKS